MVSGEVLHKSLMIRFVKDPGGRLVPDIAEKLPGRGVWCQAKRECLEQAIKTGAFNRGLKTKLIVDKGLVDLTEQLLKRRILSLMTMALKGSQLYLGFDQVKSAAQSELLSWRIEARDGSPGGRGKIRALTKAVSKEFGAAWPGVIGCFSAQELGQALGRTDIVHAAIKSGPMSKSFDLAVIRLAGFTDLVPVEWTDKDHEN